MFGICHVNRRDRDSGEVDAVAPSWLRSASERLAALWDTAGLHDVLKPFGPTAVAAVDAPDAALAEPDPVTPEPTPVESVPTLDELFGPSSEDAGPSES